MLYNYIVKHKKAILNILSWIIIFSGSVLLVLFPIVGIPRIDSYDTESLVILGIIYLAIGFIVIVFLKYR